MADKIRDFFRKKKTDQKFKQAGPGHKLTEQKPEPKRNIFSAPKEKPVQHTGEARRAGEAALARIEAIKQQNRVPNWSLEAIRAQAKKEIELETQNEPTNSSLHKIVSQESAPILSVSGVYYNCALVGPDVLPKRDMQNKIKEFLYAQLEQEPGLTACLILRTCNTNKEKVNQGVDTICKYLQNVVQNPEDEKYRKIRLQNKVFQEKVASLEGALELLNAAGFEASSDREFLILSQEKTNLDYLETLIDGLFNSEAILPQLDRNARVLLPLEAHAQIRLPDEFFNLTSEEIRREQEKKTEEVEQNAVLMTKSMRERAAQKEARLYRYTLVRVKFPDDIILQGTFTVNEKLSCVLDFIREHIVESSWQFQLSAPGGFKLDRENTDSTLLGLGLVPAVVLHLSWLGSMEDFSKAKDQAFLKPETMALLQSL